MREIAEALRYIAQVSGEETTPPRTAARVLLSSTPDECWLDPGGSVVDLPSGGHHELAERMLAERYPNWDWVSDHDLLRHADAVNADEPDLLESTPTWGLLVQGWTRIRWDNPRQVNAEVWSWNSSVRNNIENYVFGHAPEPERVWIEIDETSRFATDRLAYVDLVNGADPRLNVRAARESKAATHDAGLESAYDRAIEKLAPLGRQWVSHSLRQAKADLIQAWIDLPTDEKDALAEEVRAVFPTWSPRVFRVPTGVSEEGGTGGMSVSFSRPSYYEGPLYEYEVEPEDILLMVRMRGNPLPMDYEDEAIIKPGRELRRIAKAAARDEHGRPSGIAELLAQLDTDPIEQAIQTVYGQLTRDDEYTRENLSSKYLFGGGVCGAFALALADALGQGELVCLVGVESEEDLDDPDYSERLGNFGISPVIGRPRELLHVALRVGGQLYDGGGRVPDPEFRSWRVDHEVTELEVLDPKDPDTRAAILEATDPEQFTVEELTSLLRDALVPVPGVEPGLPA